MRRHSLAHTEASNAGRRHAQRLHLVHLQPGSVLGRSRRPFVAPVGAMPVRRITHTSGGSLPASDVPSLGHVQSLKCPARPAQDATAAAGSSAAGCAGAHDSRPSKAAASGASWPAIFRNSAPRAAAADRVHLGQTAARRSHRSPPAGKRRLPVGSQAIVDDHRGVRDLNPTSGAGFVPVHDVNAAQYVSVLTVVLP